MGGDDPRNRGDQAGDDPKGIGRRVKEAWFLPESPTRDGNDVERTGEWRERLFPDPFRADSSQAVVSSVLGGYLRLCWILIVGLTVVFIHDQIDPRRQLEYGRFLTETPLVVALGIGVVGVAVRAARGDSASPSIGAVVRTTLLLAFMLVVFALVGPTGVV